MPTERITENLTLDCLGVNLGMPNVFAQGDTHLHYSLCNGRDRSSHSKIIGSWQIIASFL